MYDSIQDIYILASGLAQSSVESLSSVRVVAYTGVLTGQSYKTLDAFFT